MPIASRRLDQLTTSVINRMILLAEEHRAINLASGDPEFETPSEIIKAAQLAMEQGHNCMKDTWGALDFRKALAEKQTKFMGIQIDPLQNITVTCGSTEAIMATVMALCDPNDHVIVFSPFYEIHTAAPLLCGCKLVFVPLHLPDLTFDQNELRKAFQKGAKAIILCNPSNPSGKVFTYNELRTIAELAQEFNTFVITDEVYEHFAYPPYSHTYIASLPGMFERTISCSSLSKTYSMTGWRIGYTIATGEVSEQIRKVHDYLTLSASEPLVWAATTGLKFPEKYYDNLRNEYIKRRSVFCDLLEKIGLDFIKPQGAFFIFADISPFGFKDDIEFCYWLVREAKVAAAPGSCFLPNPDYRYVRFSFARNIETLKEAGERIIGISEKIIGSKR